MWYRKNIPGWERALRVLMAIAMIGYGLTALSAPMGYLMAAAGLMAGLTGFIGFCPACAMVGRRLPEPK
jgi:hypothetical protein